MISFIFIMNNFLLFDLEERLTRMAHYLIKIQPRGIITRWRGFMEQHEQNFHPVEFVSSSGHKVIIPNDPSPQACERFVRVLMDIKAKNGITNN